MNIVNNTFHEVYWQSGMMESRNEIPLTPYITTGWYPQESLQGHPYTLAQTDVISQSAEMEGKDQNPLLLVLPRDGTCRSTYIS